MAKCFEWKDDVIYDELWDCHPGAALVKGQGVIKQDVFGFWLKDSETATPTTEEIAIIYRCRQVEANKRTGTGEAILAGDKLYYYPSDEKVSPTATGAVGTDYYFCGWAKKDAAASDLTVLMNFDGTNYDLSA